MSKEISTLEFYQKAAQRNLPRDVSMWKHQIESPEIIEFEDLDGESN